ncbi:MAG: hypothetical protein ACO3GW_02530 [Vulcanococcus sp.]
MIALLAIGLAGALAAVVAVLIVAWREQRNAEHGADTPDGFAFTMEGYYRALVGLYETLEHAQQQQDRPRVAELVEAIRELRQHSPFPNSEQAEP